MGGLEGLLPFLLIGAIAYLLIIRPSRNRQRQQAQIVANAQPGAEVRTIGGMYGRIIDRDDQRLRLEIAPGVTIELIASAIAEVVVPIPEPPVEDA